MYYLVYAIFYLLSLLPFWVLYGIGDLITFLIRDVFKYRKELVLKNLRLSFPEKSDREIAGIAHNFYRNFTDNWMETIKLLSISKKTLDKRYLCDYSICDEAYKTGRPLVVMGGHFFNWEWSNVMFAYRQPYPFLGVYMPLSSESFDRLFKKIRARFGTVLIKATHIRYEIIPWRGKQYALGLIADQSPGAPASSYWLDFLDRPAAVVKGPEKMARASNAIVVMIHYQKIKRGYYDVRFDYVTQEPKLEPEGAITQQFIDRLEENIRLAPDLYLWSHNRWKIAWQPEFKNLWIDKQSPMPQD